MKKRVEFYWNSIGLKGTFFHWKRVIPLEFWVESDGISNRSNGPDSTGITALIHCIPVEILANSSEEV